MQSWNSSSHLPVYGVMGLSLGVVVVDLKIRGLTIVQKYGGGRTHPAKNLASHNLGNFTWSHRAPTALAKPSLLPAVEMLQLTGASAFHTMKPIQSLSHQDC
jgi:hypothetical protein